MAAARRVSELTYHLFHHHMTQGGGCCNGRAWTTTRPRSCSRRCTSTWMYVRGLMYAFIKRGRPWATAAPIPVESQPGLDSRDRSITTFTIYRYDQMCAPNQTSEQATKRGAGWEAAAGVDQMGCVFVAAVSKVAVNPPTTPSFKAGPAAAGGSSRIGQGTFFFQVHGCVCVAVCVRASILGPVFLFIVH